MTASETGDSGLGGGSNRGNKKATQGHGWRSVEGIGTTKRQGKNDSEVDHDMPQKKTI